VSGHAAQERPAAADGASPALVVGALAGLYVGQSILSGMTYSALPAVLREQGLPLDRVGLIYLTILPWALKFLWAPAIDRYRLPPGGGRTRSRIVVAVGGLASLAGGGRVASLEPSQFTFLIGAFMLMAFAAATVDIACDGHAVETLARRHHGWGNAAQVGGAYLGAALGSGLFLVLVQDRGWSTAVLLMAALVCLGGLPFLLSRATRSPRTAAHTPSLRAAFGRPAMRAGLGLAAIFVVAQKWGASMLPPFLVDAGLDLATIGTINGLGGTAIGCGCALLGGLLVRRFGARPVLLFALALQALTLAAFALAAHRGGTPLPVLVALGLTAGSALMALGFVALYSLFMGLADPRQAGVDFTLLQCVDAAVSTAGGLAAGWLAEHAGFAAYFALAAGGAVLAWPLAARLSARVER
jgi:MFS transporter (putative signal transducer)